MQESGLGNKSINIEKLREEFKDISSHPKTIKNVKEDLEKIKKCKSYFYRKFAKDSNIESYWKNVIH